MLGYYLGVDPGVTGAVGLLDTAGHYLGVWDIPTTRQPGSAVRMFDEQALYSLFRHTLLEAPLCVVLEQVQMRASGNALTSIAKAYYGFGLLRMALVATARTPHVVQAATWKKAMGLSKEKKVSLAQARHLWPEAPLMLAKHDGRAEALLLAEYGRRYAG